VDALTEAGLRRARARAQGIDGRVTEPPSPAPPAVLRATVGVQAQEDRAAALAVRVRAPGATAAGVAACLDAGEAVVTWTLRGTRHLHAVEDVRPLLALLAPGHVTAPGRAAALGIDGAVGEAAQRALRRALAGGPLGRAAVKELLAPVGVDPSGQAPVHVIRRAALEGALVVLSGAEERYVALDDVVPPPGPAWPPPLPRSSSSSSSYPGLGGRYDLDAVAAELARRHLRAFGPVAVEDLAAWAGLPRGRARAAWRAIAGELAEVATPIGPRWVLAADLAGVRAAADAAPAGCHLLPAFDGLLLGYADRRGLVPDARARRVNAGGGLVRPTVLVDGAVVGTWRLRPAPARSGAPAAVEVAPFAPGAVAVPALQAEVDDVGRFLGSPIVLATPAG
jgi:hypothetical protein